MLISWSPRRRTVQWFSIDGDGVEKERSKGVQEMQLHQVYAEDVFRP